MPASFLPGQLSHQHKRALSVSLLLAAALYLTMAFIGGYDTFVTMAKKLGISGWFIILACSALNYLIRYLRWQYYLSKIGHRIPAKVHIFYYLAGFSLTTTPGKAGETIRSLYLRTHGVPVSVSIATFFTERFLDVICVSFYASLAILSLSQYQGFVLVTLCGALLLLPLMRSRFLIFTVDVLHDRFSGRKIKYLLHHLRQLLCTAAQLLSLKLLYPGLAGGLLAWGIQALAFIYLLHVFSIDIPLYLMFAIYAISLLAGAASFIPGGIGATEAVMSLLLISQGVDKSIAITIPIINRMTSLWFAVLLGLLSASWLSYTLADAQVDPNQDKAC